MNDPISLALALPLAMVLALLCGAVIGAVFFGGLWWTVRYGVASRWGAALFAGSLLVRMAIALGGFYLVLRGDWTGNGWIDIGMRLLACLAGFVIARIAVTRLAGTPGMPSRPAKTSHAS
jgi:F1F0 ATPase subunit 2